MAEKKPEKSEIYTGVADPSRVEQLVDTCGKLLARLRQENIMALP
jgi:hypothetical protein